MDPRCRRCGKPEAIVHLTLNRGGPRQFEWCQACLNAFRLWAVLPPEPTPTLLEQAEGMIAYALASEVK